MSHCVPLTMLLWYCGNSIKPQPLIKRTYEVLFSMQGDDNMYKIFELYGINWVEKVDKETLKEISRVLHDKVNKSDCTHFRIDNEDTPLMIIQNNEYQYQYYKKNIEKAENNIKRR